jgi:hypothetical protein
LAGDSLPQTDGSPAATMPSGPTGTILDRLASAGLNRGLAAAAVAPLVAAAVTLWLVIPTLAPGVYPGAGGGDTAEFQTVAWVLGTAHPTGYPAYVILGFIATHLLPFGDPAFRMNLLQAFLAAGAVAGLVAVIQLLTGMRWVALASGLLLVIMPTFSPVAVSFPNSGFTSTPLFWRLSTYADPHMFHVALVTLIFLLLLVWERRRTDRDAATSQRSARWLVAAAAVYGVAFANHSLTLMLTPAIGLFVLAVAPRIIQQWRLILACAAVLGATIVVLFLELPIRAAMHASLVYAHPDTWSGFLYVVMGQQFGGIPPTIGDDLGLKYATVMGLISSWLGPLGYVAVLGLGTSLVLRPRYVLLSGLSAAVTCAFAAAYANSDIERYFLVPLFVAFTYVGLGLADAISLCVWLVGAAGERLAVPPALAAEPAVAGQVTEGERTRNGEGWSRQALLAVEIVAAVVLVAASVAMIPERQHVPDGDHPGGLSQTDQTSKETWMRAVLSSPDQGGLPANTVIVSNWSDSTTLWYGQKVEGLRPDILIVDDSSRVKAVDNLGDVWDVVNSYLGRRPVFLLRFPWGVDGIDALSTMYDLRDFSLTNGGTIKQVISKKGT